jgi:hypothetical protein
MQLDVLFLVYPAAVGAVSGLVYTGNQILFVAQSTHVESMDGRERGTNHAEKKLSNREVPTLLKSASSSSQSSSC